MGSAIILVSAICRPSIIARSTPPTAAEREAARQPPRAAKTPPVSVPEMMEFHGSSFLRMATSEQSKDEKRPPHTAKLPPITGTRAYTAVMLPSSRSPRGEFLAPLMLCQRPPPMAPIEKAPPMSSRIRCGQGSRSWTLMLAEVCYCSDFYLIPALRGGGDGDTWRDAREPDGRLFRFNEPKVE